MRKKESELNKDHIFRASAMFEHTYTELIKRLNNEKMQIF